MVPLFPDPVPFRAAIRRAAASSGGAGGVVTGLIVPHHLLAIDMIARGFAAAAGRRPERLILVSPDHYRRSKKDVALCARDLESCLGRVTMDRAVVEKLLEDPAVGASSLFSHDHAVQALTPFIAHHFPGVPAVVIAIHPRAGPEVWRRLAERLQPLAGEETLVIQSTDFSHFLSWEESIRHDQQSLAVIAAGDPAGAARLDQPRHLDGRGALHVTMALQRAIGALPLVVENRNSSEYSPEPVAKTTSYMVILYGPPGLEVPGGEVLMFAGDTFTGRGMARRLDRVLPGAKRLLRDRPVVLNLEGVFATGPRPDPGRPDLAMEGGRALEALRALGTRAVCLANNHALDRGPAARAATREALEAAGIPALLPGETRDLGRFVLTALTDCDNSHAQRNGLLTGADLAALPEPPREKPWIVFLHWGAEGASEPGPRERDLARRLAERGADLLVGCHTHRPGVMFVTEGVLAAFSLGNFLFDQEDPRATGQLLELRFFRQGTVSARLLPVGNLYRGE